MPFKISRYLWLLLVPPLAACSNPDAEVNYERTDTFTRLLSQADREHASDVSPLQGEATYQGVGVLDFGIFTASADTNLVADFTRKTISGSMTDLVDGDSANYGLRGRIDLSGGSIDEDGTFTTRMAGNVERQREGVYDPDASPLVLLIDGSGSGSFHDSLQERRASHIVGEVAGTAADSTGRRGEVTGAFVAVR